MFNKKYLLFTALLENVFSNYFYVRKLDVLKDNSEKQK